jgi:hypothetical protein
MGAAHSSYAPRIHSICYYARRIVTLSPVLSLKLFFVYLPSEIECAVVCPNAHTVVVIVLICSVSQLGSGHSDQKPSVNIVDDFDFAALSGDELLTRKYGLASNHPRFDGDNSVLDDCRVAGIGIVLFVPFRSADCWVNFGEVKSVDLLRPDELPLLFVVLIDERAQFGSSSSMSLLRSSIELATDFWLENRSFSWRAFVSSAISPPVMACVALFLTAVSTFAATPFKLSRPLHFLMATS